MHLTSRDSQTLATLLPEEIALCFVLLELHYPATWIAGETGGMLAFIGERWMRGAVRQ